MWWKEIYGTLGTHLFWPSYIYMNEATGMYSREQ